MVDLFKKISKFIAVAVFSVSLLSGFSGVNVTKAEAKDEVTATYEQQSELRITDFFNSFNRLNDTSDQSVVITDRDTINAIAKEQSLADPDSIKEIRFDSVLFNSEPSSSSGINPLAVTATYHIENVQDLGSGWIVTSNYISHIFTGPAKVEQTFSKEDSSAFTGELGLKFPKVVEAKFSVVLGNKKTESTKYSFDVPKNQTIELRIYTNYRKKSYEIWALVGGLDFNQGTDYLNTAAGLYFQQIVR
ncbi:hypothetical protein D3C73_809640 [compost metagenome]